METYGLLADHSVPASMQGELIDALLAELEEGVERETAPVLAYRHFSPAVARAVHRDCFLCLASVFFSCARLRRRSSRTIPLRAATPISSAHDRFNLFDESFDKHRSLLTCGRALAAAWRPRWRRCFHARS